MSGRCDIRVLFRPSLNGWPTFTSIYYYFRNDVFPPQSSRTLLAVGFLRWYNLEMTGLTNLINLAFLELFGRCCCCVYTHIHICMHTYTHISFEFSTSAKHPRSSGILNILGVPNSLCLSGKTEGFRRTTNALTVLLENDSSCRLRSIS